MARQQQMTGRQDQGLPLLTARDRAIVLLSGVALTLVALWHAAVVLTTDVEGAQVAASVERLVTGEGLSAATWVLAAVFAVAAMAALYWLTRLTLTLRKPRQGKGLADAATVKEQFSEAKARDRALNKQWPLRPGRTAAEMKDRDEVGLWVGNELHKGSPIVLPWDSHVSVMAPTGGGKSRDLMIPAALSAPGCLVVTTNEATLLDSIATVREEKGTVWVFDPLGKTHWPVPMVWDPVAGAEDAARATARGGAFCMGVNSGAARSSGGNAAFFMGTARTAMEALLHAAALDGRTMTHVLEWGENLQNGVATPKGIIESSTSNFAERMWGGALNGVASGADETVASTRTTLQQNMKSMLRRDVLRWVDPIEAQNWVERKRAAIEATGGDSSRIKDPVVFNPAAFVESTDTLVLVSDFNDSTDVGPLCSMVFQEVIDAVKDYAPTTRHQRLEPPMRVVGDEIANVAAVEKLPGLTTEIRKLGVQLLLAFQSDNQVVTRWGENEGSTMLQNMGLEILLPGVKSQETRERFSKMAGTVTVSERSDTVDAASGQRQSAGLSLQEKDVIRPDEIRMMPDGTALAICRNVPAFMMQMVPWWERPGGKEISKASETVAIARAERASAARADHQAAQELHRQELLKRKDPGA